MFGDTYTTGMNNISMDNSGIGILFAGLGIFFIVILLIALTVLVFSIIAQWKLFKKAGKQGWEAIVPFYNNWVLIEISGLHWWYFLISLGLSLLGSAVASLAFITSIANYYINFIIYYNLAKKTKQNEILFGILGIFIPIVPLIILGFNKNITYEKNIEVKPNGVF